MTKKEHIERIREYIKNSDEAVTKAISIIYSRQTNEEKAVECTMNHNGVGFSGLDGRFGTSLGKQLAMGRTLTAKQIAFARKMMVKYARQIYDHVQENGKGPVTQRVSA